MLTNASSAMPLRDPSVGDRKFSPLLLTPCGGSRKGGHSSHLFAPCLLLPWGGMDKSDWWFGKEELGKGSSFSFSPFWKWVCPQNVPSAALCYSGSWMVKGQALPPLEATGQGRSDRVYLAPGSAFKLTCLQTEVTLSSISSVSDNVVILASLA